MATIPRARARIHSEGDYTYFPPAAGSEFLPGDLVTVNASGQITKLAAGGASAVDLALAVERFPDPYWEPQEEDPPIRQVAFLGGGVLVELNYSGVPTQADMGESREIIVDANGYQVVGPLNATTPSPTFVPIRLADELYGGVFGDTDPRVVGYFLDSVSVGE